MTELGDTVKSALKMVGITDEKVSRWLGHECGCEERRIRLNQLSIWARRILRGKPTGNLIEEEERHDN